MDNPKVLVLVFIAYAILSLIQGVHVEKWHKLGDFQKIFIETDTKYNWHKAWNECALRNMSLIIIDSGKKSEALTHLLNNTYGTSASIWIGANDMADEGDFVWHVTGKRLEFTNWTKGNPDNSNDEDCIHILGSIGYEWNDAGCHLSAGFICEQNQLLAAQRNQWELKKQVIDRLFEL